MEEEGKMKLTLRQRIVLRLTGRVYLEHRTRPGWSGALPFYAFRCPRHGIVVDYPHGYSDRLDCPRGDYSLYLKPRLEEFL
jgi:hypothetical protein